MTRKFYKAEYTCCIFEEKKRKFKDGTVSSGWLTEYDLYPNKIPSQVFDEVKSEIPTIIQIGANDGVSGEYYGFISFLETLKDFKLYLIEPQSQHIPRLQEVYEKFGDKVTYLNVAITENTGKNFLSDRDNCAQIGQGSMEVDTLSWSDFIDSFNISKIDILLMDCEGYEYNIMQQFSEKLLFPDKIRYEYPHFPNPDEVDCYLKKLGYAIQYCITDPTMDKIAIMDGQEVEYGISQYWTLPKSIL